MTNKKVEVKDEDVQAIANDAAAEDKKTTLPAESGSKKVERKKVTLSDTVAEALHVGTEAVLVEKGEVESVVEVNGKQVVVGNEEVS